MVSKIAKNVDFEKSGIDDLGVEEKIGGKMPL